MTEMGRPRGPFASAAGLLGALGGWALSSYTGASLWIPGGATLAFALIFAKTPFKPAHFVGAMSFIGGHAVWFAVATVMVGRAGTLLDPILMFAGLIWLWLRPGLWPAMALALVELGGLALNLVSLFATDVGSASHRALTVHVAFRLLGLTTLAVGYFNLRRPATSDLGHDLT